MERHEQVHEGDPASHRFNGSSAGQRRRLQNVNASNYDQGCLDGLTGTFCRLCEPHPEGFRVYYSPATTSQSARCPRCRESARDAILLTFGIIALVVIVSVVLIRAYQLCVSAQRQEQISYAWTAFSPHIKLKVSSNVASLHNYLLMCEGCAANTRAHCFVLVRAPRFSLVST